MLSNEVTELYGHRLRVRVCGVLRMGSGILAVGSRLTTEDSLFWCPPGGGVQFGESLTDALKREFREEVHLDVQVGTFICVHEHLEPPLHAIELFYEVTAPGQQQPVLGSDPEENTGTSTLRDLQIVDIHSIQQDNGDKYHPVLFQILNTI